MFRARARHVTVAVTITTCMTILAACSTAMTGSPERGAAIVAPVPQEESTTSPTSLWPALPDLPTESDPAESSAADVPAGEEDDGSLTEEGTPRDNGVADHEVGLLPDAPASDLTIVGDSGDMIDEIAAATLADLFTFYSAVFPAEFGLDYIPPSNLVSYDATDPDAMVCDESVYDFVNAFFAAFCDTVAWDRGIMMPEITEQVGTLATAIILAHEIGHDVQHLLGEPETTPTLVLEQQADCYAGAYFRWVADGNSSYLAFNQTEGMRQLLLTLLAVKDPPMMRDEFEADVDDNHGSGFDRVYAATLGYTSGAARCSAMDEAEVAERGKAFPFDDVPYQYGNLDITTDNIAGILSTVDLYFSQTQPGYTPPALQMYAGSTPPMCGTVPDTFPVAYCPETHTVSYQLAALKEIGTATEGWESANGDFSAFVLLVTRYALAAQFAGHAPITGTAAGLQALCYAGTWANWMRLPRNDYQLSPNDLDKAIYEIVSSPVAGSDVAGQTDASIIDRVEAFGYGVTTTITSCFDTYVR